MEEDHPFRCIYTMISGYLRRFPGYPISTDGATPPLAPPLPEDDLELDEQLQSFPGDIFARLLIELPDHRNHFADAYTAGDMTRLGANVHKLLGGVAYCNAPELANGLRELRLALKTDNPQTIRYYYLRAIDVIDATLRYSGYRG